MRHYNSAKMIFLHWWSIASAQQSTFHEMNIKMLFDFFVYESNSTYAEKQGEQWSFQLDLPSWLIYTESRSFKVLIQTACNLPLVCTLIVPCLFHYFGTAGRLLWLTVGCCWPLRSDLLHLSVPRAGHGQSVVGWGSARSVNGPRVSMRIWCLRRSQTIGGAPTYSRPSYIRTSKVDPEPQEWTLLYPNLKSRPSYIWTSKVDPRISEPQTPGSSEQEKLVHFW